MDACWGDCDSPLGAVERKVNTADEFAGRYFMLWCYAGGAEDAEGRARQHFRKKYGYPPQVVRPNKLAFHLDVGPIEEEAK